MVRSDGTRARKTIFMIQTKAFRKSLRQRLRANRARWGYRVPRMKRLLWLLLVPFSAEAGGA